MSRPEFLEPETLTAEVVQMVMGLVSVKVPIETIARWSHYELLLAYDWAMRQHLRASDSVVKPRPKPTFVSDAQIREAVLWPRR